MRSFDSSQWPIPLLGREENDPLERRTYRVTAKGAMIHYARILSNARQSFASYDWLKTVVY
jgi:hypothetical protein